MKNSGNKSSKSRYLKIEVGCNITHHSTILRIWLLHSPLLTQNVSLLNIIDINVLNLRKWLSLMCQKVTLTFFILYTFLHVRIHLFLIQISCKSKVQCKWYFAFYNMSEDQNISI